MPDAPVILGKLPATGYSIGPAPDYKLLDPSGAVVGSPVRGTGAGDGNVIYGWTDASGNKFPGFSSGMGGYDPNKPPDNYDPRAWAATQSDINKGALLWVDKTGYTHFAYNDYNNPAPSMDAYLAELEKMYRLSPFPSSTVNYSLSSNGSMYTQLASVGANWDAYNGKFSVVREKLKNGTPIVGIRSTTGGTQADDFGGGKGNGFYTKPENVEVYTPPPIPASPPVTAPPGSTLGDPIPQSTGPTGGSPTSVVPPTNDVVLATQVKPPTVTPTEPLAAPASDVPAWAVALGAVVLGFVFFL